MTYTPKHSSKNEIRQQLLICSSIRKLPAKIKDAPLETYKMPRWTMCIVHHLITPWLKFFRITNGPK